MKESLKITYIGGPTALLQVGELRLLTDPTFDRAGQEFQAPSYTLRKTAGPALSSDAIGRVDLVLLSHDHHFDNLDNSGRLFLQRAGTVLTTQAGAERLKGQAVGLVPWNISTWLIRLAGSSVSPQRQRATDQRVMIEAL